MVVAGGQASLVVVVGGQALLVVVAGGQALLALDVVVDKGAHMFFVFGLIAIVT